jgi:hypothetical protein
MCVLTDVIIMIDKNNNSLLISLHQRESLLMNKISSIKASIDEINRMLVSLNIDDEYRNIFLAYSESVLNLEALKRAIFLQWYSIAEPFVYTGLKDFDRHTQKNNLQVFIKYEDEGKIDIEFCMMFLHYYAISDWYFNNFFDFSPIVARLLDKKKEYANFIFPEMINRGQMGRYWQSLNLADVLKD